MTIKVSKQFLRDFACVSNRYDWTTEEIEEFKSIIRVDNEMKMYIQSLAIALRAGYNKPGSRLRQTLNSWCAQNGLKSPFISGFSEDDLAELNRMAVMLGANIH